MIGAGIALLTALAWAISSALLKFLTARVDTLALNTLRLWIGSVILLLFVLFTGRGDDFIHTPLRPLMIVIASGVIAVAAGDTLYIRSMTFIDVSRAFPVAQCTFPVLTMVAAVFLLAEPFSLFNMLGGCLVLAGLYLITITGRRSALSSGTGQAGVRGVLLALGAAVAWTAGSVLLKLGTAGMDTFVAAAIRIPAAAVALTGIVLARNRGRVWPFGQYGFRHLSMAAATGVLTYGVAAVGYVTAMQLIGVAKTVLITAVAPIFLLPLSIFILKERPSVPVIIGVTICVIGAALVGIG